VAKSLASANVIVGGQLPYISGKVRIVTGKQHRPEISIAPILNTNIVRSPEESFLVGAGFPGSPDSLPLLCRGRCVEGVLRVRHGLGDEGKAVGPRIPAALLSLKMQTRPDYGDCRLGLSQ
jgi:hypothetical protein